MGTRYTTGEDAAGIFARPAPDDLSIAVTEYELRTLLGLLRPEDALPVASRGEVFVLMPGSHTLRYVVALARMRDAQVGPEGREDTSDAQEPTQPPVSADDCQRSPETALPPNAWRITRDYYLSHHQDVRAAVARGISTASLSSLREGQRIGQLVMEHLDALFESRDVAR